MRLSPARFLGLLGALVVAVATFVALSVRSTVHLRDQAAQVDAQARALLMLREERATLVAQQPSPEAVEKRERIQAALATERAALQEQSAEFQRASLAAMRRTKAASEPSRSPPSRVSPQAAINSTILALNYGEPEELAGLIDFDPVARAEAENFFASLPPDLRTQFRSPEQLVAHVMTAKTSTVLGASGDPPVFYGPDDASLRLNLQFPHDISRTATLQFHRDGEGWRLRVPAKVIEGYRARVMGSVPVAATSPAPR